MKKLEKEEIQFIDTYLSNSDITYEDVRIEMIDHVASEIENRMNTDKSQDFYSVFKEYMIENKADIENRGSKSFNWKIFKNVSKKFLRNLYSWQVLLGSVLCFLLFDKIYSFFNIGDTLRSFFPAILMILVVIIPLAVFGKKKFTFIGNFGILVSVFTMQNYYILPYITEPSLFYYINLGIMTLIFVSSLKTMISLVVFYKKQFQVVE